MSYLLYHTKSAIRGTELLSIVINNNINNEIITLNIVYNMFENTSRI
jgi:hypothetical protein